MLISLHLPKTAGNSFASSLTKHFGEALLKDYDLPLHKTRYSRHRHALIESIRNYFRDFNNIQCIHGHFLPLKYRLYRKSNPRQFVTWMREPAERLASQYFYMKRHYTPEKAKTQLLLKRMIEEEWTLERFCLGPELRNTYSQFLWGFPLRNFDFIGIVENYESELEYFSEHFLGRPLKHYQQNVNPSTQRKSYFKDKSLKEKVLEYHSKDLELYKRALHIANTQGRLVKDTPSLL